MKDIEIPQLYHTKPYKDFLKANKLWKLYSILIHDCKAMRKKKNFTFGNHETFKFYKENGKFKFEIDYLGAIMANRLIDLTKLDDYMKLHYAEWISLNISAMSENVYRRLQVINFILKKTIPEAYDILHQKDNDFSENDKKYFKYHFDFHTFIANYPQDYLVTHRLLCNKLEALNI